MSTEGVSEAAAGQDSAAAAFVEAFAREWERPSADGLAGLACEDVILSQPLGPDLHGREAWRDEARRLLEFIPDLRAVVHRWAQTDDGVILVEFTLSGTLGGKPLAWDIIDRISLRDGLVAERRAFFDPTALVRALVTRPRAWPAWLRSGVGRPRRS